MKKFISILLAIVMVFSLAACGGGQSDQNGGAGSNGGQGSKNSAGSNGDQGGKTVKIGLLSIDDSLPFFIAKELSLYEKHNVNVELYHFKSAAEKEAAFEAGELDGDMTDLIVAALIKKGGTDMSIVCNALGAVPSEGRFMLLAAPGSNVKTTADLAKVEVAVGDNTIVHYLSDTILAKAGVAKNEIKSVNIPALSLRLEALLNGSVSAAVLPDPLASLAVMQGAVCVYDDTTSEDNLSQSIVLFSSDALANKESEIARCMDAVFEAMEYINENPNAEDVRNAILEFTSIPEILFDSYSTPSYSPRSLPSKEVVQNTMDWMAEKGLLDSIFSYEDLVDERFCTQN